jgi:hypothetical protein
VLSLATPHDRHGLPVQWHDEISLGLGQIGMDPGMLAFQVNLRPLQSQYIGLP